MVLVQLVPAADLGGPGAISGQDCGMCKSPWGNHIRTCPYATLFFTLKIVCSLSVSNNLCRSQCHSVTALAAFLQKKCTLLHLWPVCYHIGSRMDQGTIFASGAHHQTPHPRVFSKKAWLHFALWVGHMGQESEKLCPAFPGFTHQEIHLI